MGSAYLGKALLALLSPTAVPNYKTLLGYLWYCLALLYMPVARQLMKSESLMPDPNSNGFISHASLAYKAAVPDNVKHYPSNIRRADMAVGP